jgi:hypothetical protein
MAGKTDALAVIDDIDIPDRLGTASRTFAIDRYELL